MAAVEFKVEEYTGIIGERKNWKKEVRKISWNGKPAKYDIREWDSEDPARMSKGITLSEEEMKALYDILKNIYEN